MSAIKFVYFDLGKVILEFSHQRMIDQVAAVADISPQQVRTHMFDNDLENRYETGEFNSKEFHASFCRLAGCECDMNEFLTACGNIFELKTATMPVISQLVQLDVGLGILSNTCPAHWDWAVSRFPMLKELFPVHITSFEVKSMKPENIEAAQKQGLQAFLFTDATQMLHDLFNSGVAVG